MRQIKWVSPHGLKPNPRNVRTHSKKQIHQIADSVLAFGFVVPIVVDENNTILRVTRGPLLIGGRYAFEP